MFVVTTVGSSSAGGGGEERPLWSWDGVPSPLSITMVRMKVRGNRTRKPTAKNIALELGSNAEKCITKSRLSLETGGLYLNRGN